MCLKWTKLNSSKIFNVKPIYIKYKVILTLNYVPVANNVCNLPTEKKSYRDSSLYYCEITQHSTIYAQLPLVHISPKHIILLYGSSVGNKDEKPTISHMIQSIVSYYEHNTTTYITHHRTTLPKMCVRLSRIIG